MGKELKERLHIFQEMDLICVGIGENTKTEGYKYSFIIEPDGTGLYYDFGASTDGTAKPRGIYQTKKF